MGKKLLITEDDRKHILSLYGLINEVETEPKSAAGTVSTSELTLDKRIEFGPGYYKPEFSYTSPNTGISYDWDVDETLNTGLNNIKEFLKNNPTGYIVDVTLEAGESKIPNNDAELGGRPEVESGYLNEKRLETLKTYLTPIFESWKQEGINTNFKINEKTTIGPTEWVGTPFCPSGSDAKTQRQTCYNNYVSMLKAGNTEVKTLADKYNSEQYFRVIINVNKTEPTTNPNEVDISKCAVEMEINMYVPSHNCQNAEFFIFANDTLLYNIKGGMTANMNTGLDARGIPTAEAVPAFIPEVLNPGYGYLKNGDSTYINSYAYGRKNKDGDNDGRRADTFRITKEQSYEIMSKSNGIIDIWMIATTTTAHQDLPNVVISAGKNVIYRGEPKIVQGKVLTINGCTYEVIENDQSEIPDVTGYVDILKQEKMTIQTEIENERLLSKGSEKSIEKKKMKIDEKSLVLERASTMVTEMTTFLNYLKPALESTIPKDEDGEVDTSIRNIGSPEIRAEIERYYKIFYDYINYTGTEEYPQPSFAKNEEGEYIDETIRKDKLYEDIRIYLVQFYEGFDIVYLGNEGYDSKGRQYKGNLNGTAILNSLKRIENYAL